MLSVPFKVLNAVFIILTVQATSFATLMRSEPVKQSFKHFAYLLNILYILYTINCVCSIRNIHNY